VQPESPSITTKHSRRFRYSPPEDRCNLQRPSPNSANLWVDYQRSPRPPADTNLHLHGRVQHRLNAASHHTRCDAIDIYVGLYNAGRNQPDHHESYHDARSAQFSLDRAWRTLPLKPRIIIALVDKPNFVKVPAYVGGLLHHLGGGFAEHSRFRATAHPF